MTKTKIIATIGPASFEKKILRKIILNGADIIRFNFSHAENSQTLKNIADLNSLNRSMKRAIKKMADLKGNRIRVSSLKTELKIKKNQILTIANAFYNKKYDLKFDYEGSFIPARPKHRIYIEDGKIELEILKSEKSFIIAKVLIGKTIKNAKGVNFPDSVLNFPLLNKEDEADLIFACQNNFDYIAHSFVRSEKDISALRASAKKHGFKNIKVIAKIENREALSNIEKILNASDGIMVARGDLGISINLYEVPLVQKELLKKAKKRKKFSIVATQMLESMTENYKPTRAEVSDVANAVLDGADSVMLSGETANGNYPAQSVLAMNEIIKITEKNFYADKH